ncbi:MAG: DUF4190 domain-containing protein [Clostridia bacterium]|nr:DUF4190 domain-containing protein [Clostridia bacterium]
MKKSGFYTAAKVFIILGMIFQFYLIYPLIVGGIALSKLNSATTKDDLTAIGIITIFFCSIIGGIFMLCVKDEDFDYKKENKMNDRNENNPFESGSGNWTPTPAPDGGNEVKNETVRDNPYLNGAEENKAEGENAGAQANEISGNPYVDEYYSGNRQPEPTRKKSSGLATAAMVLGIVSLSLCIVCCCCSYVTWVISIVCGVVGLILGIVALAKGGVNAKALVGLILSAVAILLSIILMVVFGIYSEFILNYIRENYPDIYDQYYEDSTDSTGRGMMILQRIIYIFRK